MSTQDQHNMAIAKLRAVNPSYLFESPKMTVGGSEPWQATAQLLNAMSYYRDMMNARKGQEELYNNKTNQYNIPDSVSYSNGTQSGLYVGADGKLYLDTPSSYTSNGYVYTPTDNGAITVNGGGSLSPAQTAGINLGTGTQWDGAVTPTGQGISITGGNSSANANTMSYGNMANQDTVTPSGQGINIGNTADNQVPIYTAHGILNGESTGTKFDSLANKNTNTNDDWLKPITPTYNNNQSNPSTDISMAGDQNRQNAYNQQNDKNPTYFTNGKYSVSSFKNPATEQTVLPTDSGNEADGRYRDIVDNPATDTEVEQNHPMRALVEDYFANRNAQALKDYPDMTFNDDGVQMNESLPFKQRVEDYVAQRKAQELANYPNVRPDYSFNPQTDTEYEQNEYYDNNPPARGNTNWDKALNPEGYTGNIDLSNRPQVTNPDGSISTVRSKSFNIDGKEVLLPTISPDGKNLTDQEAIDLYKSTGQNLGVFNTVEEANKAAQDIHNQQAQQIAQPQAQTPTQQPSNGLSINAGTQETSSSAPMSPQNSIDIKGDYGKDANTLMNREQYYNALERDGVKNPFIREALYEQNIAPLEEETRRNNLENAFKTYLNPNATPEEKEKAKTTIAVLTGKPTMWEDRDFVKQQYNDKMKMEQERMDLTKQRYADELAYKQQKYKDSQGRYIGENLEGQTWDRASNNVNLSDVQPETLAGINAISKIYKNIFGKNMLITSGADGSHAGGTYSHANGWKVDLSGNGLEDDEKREQFIAEVRKLGIVPYDEYNPDNWTENTSGNNLDLSFQGYNGKVLTTRTSGKTSRGSIDRNAFNPDKYNSSAMDYGQTLSDYKDLLKEKNTIEASGDKFPKDKAKELSNLEDKLDKQEQTYVDQVGKIYDENLDKYDGAKNQINEAAIYTYHQLNENTKNGLDPVGLSWIIAKAASHKTGAGTPDTIQGYILERINKENGNGGDSSDGGSSDDGGTPTPDGDKLPWQEIRFKDEGFPRMRDMSNFDEAVAWANAAATYLGAKAQRPDGSTRSFPTNTSRQYVYQLLKKYYKDNAPNDEWIDDVASQAGLFEQEADSFGNGEGTPRDVRRSANHNY